MSVYSRFCEFGPINKNVTFYTQMAMIEICLSFQILHLNSPVGSLKIIRNLPRSDIQIIKVDLGELIVFFRHPQIDTIKSRASFAYPSVKPRQLEWREKNINFKNFLLLLLPLNYLISPKKIVFIQVFIKGNKILLSLAQTQF